MNGNELLTIEVANFAEYVLARKIQSGLSIDNFAKMVDMTKGEISKVTNRQRKSVSLYSFYKIAILSGDMIENVRDTVYTKRNLELVTDYKLEERTNFGTFMRDEVEGDNTFDIIMCKTGIEKQRLIDIYYNTGAPEPFELLLIEKATGRKPGELMGKYIAKYPIKKKGE
jgi:transcriptional regulator with XRE-family HTH domain